MVPVKKFGHASTRSLYDDFYKLYFYNHSLMNMFVANAFLYIISLYIGKVERNYMF